MKVQRNLLRSRILALDRAQPLRIIALPIIELREVTSVDAHILIVEDQSEISGILIKYLDQEHYTHQLAADGFDALDRFARETFHLVILDIMMPGIDGFDVLETIRRSSRVPVILLTAREKEADRLKGFDLGADDYVVKPFSPRELMRRIRALLRRVYPDTAEEVLESGGLRMDLGGEQLFKNGETIPLTHAEFLLLKTLMSNPGIILSRDQLMESSFGVNYEGVDRNIDSQIKRLRQKIEDDPHEPVYIRTRYGAGYVFEGRV